MMSAMLSEARDRVMVAAALVAQAARGLDVALLKQRFDEHELAIDRLIAAAKHEQATEDLKVVMREGGGHA